MYNLSHISKRCGVLVFCAAAACSSDPQLTEATEELSNNHLVQNEAGKSSSFSTQGHINEADEFFIPQGTNGRHCETCHVLEDGWSITAATAQRFFDETGGLHPLFNLIDADRPDPMQDLSTVEAR